MRPTLRSLGQIAMCIALLCGGFAAGGRAGASQAGVTDRTNASSLGTALDLTAGYSHTCALAEGGSVYCWGAYDASIWSYPDPHLIDGLGTATAISAGNFHTCAIQDDATVRCWGRNSYGQLGNGTFNDSMVPVAVSGLNNVRVIAGGHYATCAIKTDGSVWCWGYNNGSLLGYWGPGSNVPVMVAGVSDVVAIALGESFACAALRDGTARCWGDNTSGQLGDGTIIEYGGRPTPGPVSGLTDVVALSAGDDFACALRRDGTARCWGNNYFGTLGDGTTIHRTTPVAVGGLSGVVAISSGEYHTCARGSDGLVRCWGRGAAGRLGYGGDADRPLPTLVASLSGLTLLDSGGVHTCASRSDTTIWCWGDNWSYQLGNDTIRYSLVPVPVFGWTPGTPTLTPTSLPPTATPGPFVARINFQPPGTPVPVGYIADTGETFSAKPNGYTYGWNRDNRANARDRNAPNSPDQRYDTFIHMQLSNWFEWELLVPNGLYDVRAVMGDPSFADGRYVLGVEGQHILDGVPTTSSRWVEGRATIRVSDGKLTLRNGYESQNNKLAFIEVSAVTGTPTATSVPTGTPMPTGTPTSTGMPTSTPTATPTAMPTGTPTPEVPWAIRINFQPASAPVPDGYLVDSGAPYGPRGNGHSYGWGSENGPNTRDRDAANSPDQRYDTFIHTQLTGRASWQIAVPSGEYTVHLVAGDPLYYDSFYRVTAEGVLVVDGTPTNQSRWVAGVRTVTVRDGKLSIVTADGAVNTKLAFIEIRPATR